MKRNLLLTALAGIILASCTQKDLYDPQKNNENYVKTDLTNIVPTRTFTVNVEQGKVAIVTNKTTKDTIAVLAETRAIDIPVSLSSNTRAYNANDYNVEVNYITADQINGMTTKLYYYNTVAFEDANGDDYDYNDLIFHTTMRFAANGAKWGSTVKLQPIAFGAQNTIDLTAMAYVFNTYGEKVDSCCVIDIKDVRKNMFLSTGTEFINTDKSEITKNGGLTFFNLTFDNWFQFPVVAADQYIDVVYSIYVRETGKTYYSIPMTQRLAEKMVSSGKNYNISFDKNNIPFGLVFSDIWGGRPFTSSETKWMGAEWFNYPQEREPIDNVYPNFRKWLAGEQSTVNWSNPQGNYVNAIGDPDEKSLYDYTTKKKGGKETVTRKNPWKFDITKFYAE